MKFRFYLFLLFVPVMLLSSCGGVNVFSVKDDIALGKNLKDEFVENKSDFDVLDKDENKQAYDYLNGIKDKILNSGHVKHKDDFEWELYIVEDDSVLNAFCVPGGYIFVYTGLIKYLDSEDQMAGILGHEIAHADKRHTTQQMTKVYGLHLLMQIALGRNRGALSNIAEGLIGLGFSRHHEEEADRMAVEYLCATDYNADGCSVFFEKLKKDGKDDVMVSFLSTHPDPGNRVEKIRKKETELGCTGANTYDTEYAAFKQLFQSTGKAASQVQPE